MLPRLDFSDVNHDDIKLLKVLVGGLRSKFRVRIELENREGTILFICSLMEDTTIPKVLSPAINILRQKINDVLIIPPKLLTEQNEDYDIYSEDVDNHGLCAWWALNQANSRDWWLKNSTEEYFHREKGFPVLGRSSFYTTSVNQVYNLSCATPVEACNFLRSKWLEEIEWAIDAQMFKLTQPALEVHND